MRDSTLLASVGRWSFDVKSVRTSVRPIFLLPCTVLCAFAGGWLLLQQRCPLRLSVQHVTNDPSGLSQVLLEVSNISHRGLIFEYSLEKEVAGGWIPATPQPVFADFPIWQPGNSSQTITNDLPPGSAQLRFAVTYQQTNLSFAEKLVDQVAARLQQRGFTRFAHDLRLRRLTSSVLTHQTSNYAIQATNP